MHIRQAFIYLSIFLSIYLSADTISSMTHLVTGTFLHTLVQISFLQTHTLQIQQQLLIFSASLFLSVRACARACVCVTCPFMYIVFHFSSLYLSAPIWQMHINR